MIDDRRPSYQGSTLCYTRWFPHPVQRVWRAITDPAHLERWIAPARVELRPGGAFRLGPACEPWLVATITEIASPHLLVLRCEGPDGGSIRFELREEAGGCLMTIIERPGPELAGPDVGSGKDEPVAPQTATGLGLTTWRRLAARGARTRYGCMGDLPQASARCRGARAAGHTGVRGRLFISARRRYPAPHSTRVGADWPR